MMNMDKLSRAGNSIHLSEEAKHQIIAGCKKTVQNESGYTDHVFTVERYKPRKLARFAGVAASFVLAVGGTCATVYTLKNISANNETSTPGSSIERYTGKPISEPHPIEYTPLDEYFEHNLIGSGKLLSESQRQRIYALLKDLIYTELDNYEVETPRTRGLFYTIKENDYYSDGEYSMLIENDYLMMNWDAFLQPGTYGWQYYKLSENIEERFNEIYDEEFGPILDNAFYAYEKGDIDEECRTEIIEFLRNLKYEDSYTVISDVADETNEESVYDLNAISLHFENEEYTCELIISGNNFTFKADYIDQASENKGILHLKQTCKAATSDNISSKLKMFIFKSHFFSILNKDFEITGVNIPGEDTTETPLKINDNQRTRVRELLTRANYKFATEYSDLNNAPSAQMTYSDEKYDYNVIFSGQYIVYRRENKLERNGEIENIKFKSDYDDICQILIAAIYGNDFVKKP